ncbi:MAG: penicillin-binding protein [Candidatus Ancillula sp.]|jgi:membrane peptidoglycan carboxypeptidase|nr:penicillin-binding protein [Candidatus Ancillula sp.]
MKKVVRFLFDPTKVRSKVLAVVSLVILGLLSGVALAGILLPVAVGVNQFKDVADNVIDDIAIDEYNGVLSSQTTMYANDNTTVLAKFYAQDRIVVPLDMISQNLKNAVIAREDKRFYDHSGLDPMGLARGLFKNYTSGGEDTQGGSTITQQYIKNLLIDKALQEDDPISAFHAKEQTLYRKIKEAKFAFEIEAKLTKDQILEGYLNVAPFGPNVYGAESSAQRYFSKPASDLNPNEAAMIAAITKWPVMYDPFTYPDETRKQRNIVLALMLDQGYITQAEYDQDIAIPIEEMLHPSVVPVGCQAAGGAAFFCDYVTNVILNDERYGKTRADRKRFLYQGGLSIYTTLDARYQNVAQRVAAEAIPPDDQPLMLEDAIVTIEPGTGKVLAMAQNRPYNAAQTDPAAVDTAINYGVGLKEGGSNGFSPGSTIKLITVTNWLKNGHSMNESIAGKVKYPFYTAEFACSAPSSPWAPKNDNGSVSIATPLVAFQQSMNVPMAMMGAIDGLCTWTQTAKDLGFVDQLKGDITNPENIIPPILLGTVNATPLTMAEVYSTIAGGGVHCSPIPIMRIADESGNEYSVPSANCKQVVDKNVADTAFYALKTNVTNGIARQAGIRGREVGAKTGTSEQNMHLWTAGCVPQACTAVWAGNAQYDIPLLGVKINGRYKGIWWGGDLAGPIFSNYMSEALNAAGVPNTPIPAADQKMLYGAPKPKDPDPQGSNPNNSGAAQTTPSTYSAPAPTPAPSPPAASTQPGQRLPGAPLHGGQ